MLVHCGLGLRVGHEDRVRLCLIVVFRPADVADGVSRNTQAAARAHGSAALRGQWDVAPTIGALEDVLHLRFLKGGDGLAHTFLLSSRQRGARTCCARGNAKSDPRARSGADRRKHLGEKNGWAWGGYVGRDGQVCGWPTNRNGTSRGDQLGFPHGSWAGERIRGSRRDDEATEGGLSVAAGQAATWSSNQSLEGDMVRGDGGVGVKRGGGDGATVRDVVELDTDPTAVTVAGEGHAAGPLTEPDEGVGIEGLLRSGRLSP